MRVRRGPIEGWLLAALIAALMVLPVGFVAAEEQPDPEPAAAEREIVFYYFHGARRCKTCRSIESYAKGVVNSRFADEVESGALVWSVVDYDQPENRHFVDDFGLFTSSLVVVQMEQGKMVEFEVLQEAWSLVRDKTRFQQYVYRALHKHLG